MEEVVSDQFSISSSGALFVRVLGRIMREKLEIKFDTHEHWDFVTAPERYGVISKGVRHWYLCTGEGVALGLHSRDREELVPLQMRAMLRRVNPLQSEPGTNEVWEFHWWGKTSKLLMDAYSCQYSLHEDKLMDVAHQPQSIHPKIVNWLQTEL